MGILGEDELTSRSIGRMILHVVHGDPEIAFVEQSEFDEIEHGEFFLARLQDVDVAPVHDFADASETKLLIEAMAKGEVSFEQGAQRLSRQFANQHRGTSSDGAFFVFELVGDTENDIVFAMAKYDYSQAVERFDNEGKSGLRQIVQAFIADRKAIQKSCFIRVIDGKAEKAVSARDRSKQAPDLTDYFCKFLDVARSRSDKELTDAVKEAILKAIKDCKEDLPDTVAAAYKCAREALSQRANIDNDAVVEAVLLAAGSPDDEAVRSRVDKTVRRSLKSRKLDGVSFKPQRHLLEVAKRQKVETSEGVRLDYPGSLENNGVIREALSGGGTRFIIETAKKLIVDEPVAERVRP